MPRAIQTYYIIFTCLVQIYYTIFTCLGLDSAQHSNILHNLYMPRAGFRPTFKYTTPSLHAFFVWCVWIPDKVPQPKHVRLGHFVLASRMVLVTGASYWLETIRMSWFSQLSVELLTFPYVCALHFWLLILYNSVDGSLFFRQLF